jgi:ferredoxin
MSSAPPLPILHASQPDPESETATLRTLHHFHLGDTSVERETLSINCEHLPALLSPFRDASKIRYDYPLILFSRYSEYRNQYAQPLSTFLKEHIESFAPGENSARILKDNLDWLEYAIRKAIQGQEGPQPLHPAIQYACEALQQHLALSEDNHANLQGDLDKLIEGVTAKDQLLPYDRYTAIYLMIHLVHSRSESRWDQFEKELSALHRQLDQLLEVERHKLGDNSAEALQRSVGSNASHFNTDILSTLMPQQSATVMMSEERRSRVEKAVAILGTFKRDPVQVRFIHGGDFSGPWSEHPDHFETIINSDPCSKATVLFDTEAKELAELFCACRVAQLEISNHYDPVVHDPWIENFSWEAFSEEELLLVPATVALEPANRLAHEGLGSFSQLLGSGRPIQILTRVKGHDNPAVNQGESPFHDFRLELGYIATAHRQCYVSQTSSARYQHLMQGFLEATEIPRTGVHLINTGIQDEIILQETDPHLIGSNVQKSRKQFLMDPWMVSGAALEGRVHPFYRINPNRGDTFAERMDFSVNPQADKDWAIHPFSYRNDAAEMVHTELAFTFADYALLIPRLRTHFRQIPRNFDSDKLVPIADYLTHSDEEAFSLIPFVWTVNEENELNKVVVSRELVLACKDRLNYWHTLQELSGVRNPHADQAVNAANLLLEAKHNSQISELNAAHEAEMSQLRSNATTEVMSKLTQVLMGMDLQQGFAATPKAVASATTTALSESNNDTTEMADAAAEPAPEEAVPEPEVEVSEDPWIESMLCTTCNDCLNINPQLFVYNDDKQAYITDPNLGTYAQMVEAAEICPSRCIHPGMPLNSSEPDLDELIERAAPFNQ